jgi:phosphatidylglycerophosphate synthase
LKYLADTLTVSRFVFALLAALTILRGEWDVAVLFVLCGGLSDAFDGMAARKWPLADNKRFYIQWLKPKDFDEIADAFFCVVLVFAPAIRLIVANVNGWQDGWVPLWFSIPLLVIEMFMTPFFLQATQRLNPVDAFEADVLHGWYCAALMVGSLLLVTWMGFSGVAIWLLFMAYALACFVLVVVKWDRATTRPGVVYTGRLSWSQFLRLQWK